MTMLRGLTPFAAAAGFALVAAMPALAGRPLSTEDASVLGDGQCQLEAWIDRSKDATIGWLVPACNLGAGIEWQAGFARTREAGTGRFSDAYFQAKGVFVEPAEGRFGIGLVVGVVRQPLNETKRGWENPYLIVPVTRAFGETLVHANLGWLHDREGRRDLTLWGIAIETPVADRLAVVAETFGENSSRPFFRAGVRWTAIPEVLDLDLTAVVRHQGDRADRYLSLGFTWVP